MKIKGVNHIHTFYSHDSNCAIDNLVAKAKEMGYSFMIVSDHANDLNTEKVESLINDCRSLSTDNFIVIPGVEYSFDNNTHVAFIGINSPLTSTTPEALIREAHNQNAIGVLCHPGSITSANYPEWIKELDGAELWNARFASAWAPDKKSFDVMNDLLQINPNLTSWSGLDLHYMWELKKLYLELNVSNLSEQEIMSCLKSGTFRIGHWIFKFNKNNKLGFLQKLFARFLSLSYYHAVRLLNRQ